jgi:hypothetical protein
MDMSVEWVAVQQHMEAPVENQFVVPVVLAMQ